MLCLTPRKPLPRPPRENQPFAKGSVNPTTSCRRQEPSTCPCHAPPCSQVLLNPILQPFAAPETFPVPMCGLPREAGSFWRKARYREAVRSSRKVADPWLGGSSYGTLGKLSVRPLGRGLEHSTHFIKLLSLWASWKPSSLAYRRGVITSPPPGGSLRRFGVMAETSLGPSLTHRSHSIATWQRLLPSLRLGAEKSLHKRLWNELNERRESDINSDMEGNVFSHALNRASLRAYHHVPGCALGAERQQQKDLRPMKCSFAWGRQGIDRESDREIKAATVSSAMVSRGTKSGVGASEGWARAA